LRVADLASRLARHAITRAGEAGKTGRSNTAFARQALAVIGAPHAQPLQTFEGHRTILGGGATKVGNAVLAYRHTALGLTAFQIHRATLGTFAGGQRTFETLRTLFVNAFPRGPQVGNDTGAADALGLGVATQLALQIIQTTDAHTHLAFHQERALIIGGTCLHNIPDT